MLVNCTTKGCLKSSEAKLNRDNNKVYCDECGNEILNITEYTKKALNSMGQVLRTKKKEPFQTYCKNCNENRSLYVKEDKAYCKTCDFQIQVSNAFLHGLKLYLEGKEKEKEE